MAKLFVRAALSNCYESKFLQDSDNFFWFQYGIRAHPSSDLHRLNTDKLSLNSGLPVLKQHFNHFSEVLIKFVQGFRLRVCTGKSGHISNIQAGFRALLYYRSKCLHIQFSELSISLPGKKRLATRYKA